MTSHVSTPSYTCGAIWCVNRRDGSRVAVQMSFSHTDTVSRPEVVESRIAWLLAQKYKTTASTDYVIGNLKAIVNSISGQKLSGKYRSIYCMQ